MIEIIRRKKRIDFEDKKGEQKYQYIYRKDGRAISLVYLECRGRTFMWEAHSLSLHIALDIRFYTKEEAEGTIRRLLLGDDLKDLVEWKIAKQNIIIQE